MAGIIHAGAVSSPPSTGEPLPSTSRAEQTVCVAEKHADRSTSRMWSVAAAHTGRAITGRIITYFAKRWPAPQQ
jgi:hypothetical protein